MSTLTAGLPGAVSALANAGLCVQRTAIQFEDVAPGLVAVRVTVANLGHQPTSPTFAVLSAAPLGAFVPWKPLTALPVPVLGPGESVTLHTEVGRPAPAALGWPEQVTPEQLLEALEGPPAAPLQPGLTQQPLLPADPADLLGRSNAYWAGNLNVFVGQQAVERHMARALRIYPGRLNLAMFVVGDRRPDAYRFRLFGTGDNWGATLGDASCGTPRGLFRGGHVPIEPDRWIESAGQRLVMLALRPPRDRETGCVEVHVTQRSTARQAVVEFTFDARADGPGCYVVE
jgi:hypothetical protein